MKPMNAAATPPATETSQMEDAMKRLVSATMQISDALARIRDQLDPVLLPDTPTQTGCCVASAPEPLAPLCSQIREIEQRIQSTTNLAANILSRLAL